MDLNKIDLNGLTALWKTAQNIEDLHCSIEKELKKRINENKSININSSHIMSKTINPIKLFFLLTIGILLFSSGVIGKTKYVKFQSRFSVKTCKFRDKGTTFPNIKKVHK